MAVFLNAESVRRHAGAILALGVLDIILGIGALVFVGFATVFSVAMLGAIFLVDGIAEVIFGIRTRQEGRLAYHLFVGVLVAILGGFILANPVANAAGITLLIGLLCLVSGASRVLAVLFDGARGNGSVLWSGLLTALVGVLVLSRWPSSSLWTVGIFVGVSLLMYGSVLVRLGVGGRRIARAIDQRPGAATTPPPFPQRQVS